MTLLSIGVALLAAVQRPAWASGIVNCNEETCSNPCITLNGNLTYECGSCSSEVTCHPGAPYFDSWPQRMTAKDGAAVEEVAALPADSQMATAAATVEQAPTVAATAQRRPPQPSTPLPGLSICPDDLASQQNGLQSLPVLKRFCRRALPRCGKVNAALAWHLENVQPGDMALTRPALLHREKPRVGAGYAHVLQEQAQLLLLAVVLARPLLLHSIGDVFNKAGSLLGPDAPLATRLYAPLDKLDAGFGSFLMCRAAMRKYVGEGSILPFRCKRADGDDGGGGGAAAGGGADGDASAAEGRGARRWFLALDDGNAWSVLNSPTLKARYNRFTHVAKQAPLSDYLPRGPTLFSSPSVIAMYLSDLVQADGALDARKRNPKASIAELTGGANDLAGPACLLRALVARASEPLLKALVNATGPTAPPPGANDEGALLVGVHLRQGDARMQKECPRCINGDDPDVIDKQVRIPPEELKRQLACVNASLDALAAAAGRKAYAFVASDTHEGLTLARAALGVSRVLSIPGQAVHSTREEAGILAGATSDGATSDGAAAGAAALKIGGDFLGLAVADVHFGLGDSSFLGNAAAVGMGSVIRVGDRVASGNVCKPLTPLELATIAEQLKQPGKTPEEALERPHPQHVEL